MEMIKRQSLSKASLDESERMLSKMKLKSKTSTTREKTLRGETSTRYDGKKSLDFIMI